MISEDDTLKTISYPRTAGRALCAFTLSASLLVLAACDGSSNNSQPAANEPAPSTPTVPTTPTPPATPTPPPVKAEQLAFAATRSGFTSGRIDRISLDQGDVVTGSYPATASSDITARTDGTSLYQLGRFQLDSLTKFTADDTSTPVYQYSVNGSESGSNPYDVVFASAEKAYVLRYGSPIVWVINPSATDEASFKIGELNLSAYDTEDVSPEPSSGVIVDGKLFVLMERISRRAEGWAPLRSSYIAVFDISDDSEINTGKGTADQLPGIALNTRNSAALVYNAADKMLYVTGRGNYFASNTNDGDRYTGGVEKIDPSSYDVTLLSDDGNEADHPYDFYSQMLPVSETKGYLLSYQSFGSTTLRSINLETGEVTAAPVAGLDGIDITSLSIDPKNRVWLGINNAQTPGFRLLNPSDDSVIKELVATELSPINVVFTQ